MDVHIVERLIETKMEPRLHVLVGRMEHIRRVKEEHEALRDSLLGEKRGDQQSTLVDLGGGFHVETEAIDKDTIYIDVGLGFHVEYSSDDAIVHVCERIELLER